MFIKLQAGSVYFNTGYTDKTTQSGWKIDQPKFFIDKLKKMMNEFL